jgi:hypothetical protein
MKHESQRPIGIEELLRLKRAERPPAEFWTEFDRKLRAKQLAALVEKRPWWQSVPLSLPRFSRFYLPIGATALLAVSIITVRETSEAGSGLADSAVESPRVATLDAGVRYGAELASPDEGVSSAGAAAELRAGAAVASDETNAGAGDRPFDATTPGELSRMIPLLGISGVTVTETSEAVMPRYAVDALPRPGAEVIEARHSLVKLNGFETRNLSARSPVEPLQQITPPSERTRTKLLTAMVSMTATGAASRAGERTANRLSEEQLYDQIHRFGARGAGVSMKF